MLGGQGKSQSCFGGFHVYQRQDSHRDQRQGDPCLRAQVQSRAPRAWFRTLCLLRRGEGNHSGEGMDRRGCKHPRGKEEPRPCRGGAAAEGERLGK